MHATEFLANPTKPDLGGVVVLHGSEDHLRKEVLTHIIRRILGPDAEIELSVTRFTGKDTDLSTVRDELQTVSMFASSRVVVVEEAEEFVSKNRPGLEDYFDQASTRSMLVLIVKSWPKNTKLYKKLSKVGLDVDCGELTGPQLAAWLIEQARDTYEKQLSRDAANLMFELAGTGLGLLTRELEKLVSYVGDNPKIGVEDVRTLVGGWRAETTWVMINAVRDGQPGEALAALDKLLNAGEAPQKIMGGINFVFRKLAQTTERSRGGMNLKAAMTKSGVYYRETDAAERFLRRIGRPRAERITSLLAETDANLKGGSRISERLQLERLLLELGGNIPLH